MRGPGHFTHGQTIAVGSRRPMTGSNKYDAYGNLQYRAVESIVRGIAIYPLSLTESEAGGEFQRSTSLYTCLLPPELKVNNVDYVLWRGRRYEIAGEPAQYRSPHTGTSFQQVTLRRVEG